MRRLPLADQLPYRFYPPRIHPLWIWLGRFYIRRQVRRVFRVHAIEVVGLEPLKPLLERGDGVLIAPNHGDNADGGVMFEVGLRAGRPFCFMAAYQLFTGLNRFHLPRIGAFPVDREGADRRAFKAGVEVLTAGRHPLVVFPEGEIYHMADRLTPLREGAAVLAVAAARKLAEAGRTAWIVPAAIKYRFLDGHDPLPALERLMTDLEARFTWWPRTGHDLVERIYFYAEGMLALKELEYLGEVRHGPVKERIAALRASLLDRIEDRRLGRRSSDPDPVRVKELRRACLDALAAPGVTTEEAEALRRDLNDLFAAVQLYSYPGDYVKGCPTVERVAETLMKFEQDVFGITDLIRPRGPRRALVRLGAPIDVAALGSSGKPRHAASALTAELERRIQGLLDAIGTGRPLPAARPSRQPDAEPATPHRTAFIQ
jgi:1-acyl-sn-glycerol-3-phosphate acyltransferase